MYLNINNFFPPGSKTLIFCEHVILPKNIVDTKYNDIISFGSGYIYVYFWKLVPLFNKELQENLWSYMPKTLSECPRGVAGSESNFVFNKPQQIFG